MDVNTVFKTFEEFQASLRELEASTFNVFVLKTSEKASTANKRRKIQVPPSFPFARQHYTCSHFGSVRKYKRNESQECLKANSRSTKVGCEASFVISYDDRRNGMVVTKSHMEHNHHSDENTYAREYKMKRLNCDQRKELQDVVNVNPNNEKLLQFIKAKYGKSLSLADVRSLKFQLKRTDTQSCHVRQLLSALTEVDGYGPFELTLSENKEEVYIDMVAFCTKEMISLYHEFPEVIYMDGTYKVNQSGYPLYQLMVEDNAGHGRPVYYAFLRVETADMLSHMLSVFKNFVVDASKTNIFMTDKCAMERQAVRSVFPDAKPLLCHFHVHKSFREKISTLSMLKDQKQTLKACVYQLVNVECEAQFVKLLDQISSAFPIFFQYLEKNWLASDVINHWPTCKRLGLRSFGSDTNNICESENKRIKRLLCASKSLAMSVIELLHHSRVQQGEVLQERFNATVTKTTYRSAKSSVLPLYERFVQFAVKKMVKNHENASSNVLSPSSDAFVCTDENSSCKLVKEDRKWICHCPFYKQTTLPCNHLVSLTLNNFSTFDEIVSENNRYLRCKTIPVAVPSSTENTLPVRKHLITSPASRHHKTETVLAQLSVFKIVWHLRIQRAHSFH